MIGREIWRQNLKYIKHMTKFKHETNGAEKVNADNYNYLFRNTITKYTQATAQEYESALKSMSFLNLQNECRRVKLNSATNRGLMVLNLMKQYDKNKRDEAANK